MGKKCDMALTKVSQIRSFTEYKIFSAKSCTNCKGFSPNRNASEKKN